VDPKQEDHQRNQIGVTMYTLEDGSNVKDVPDNYTGSLTNSYYGIKTWYQDGKMHRVDAPAREWDSGSKAWYQYGKKHRIDGPAWEAYDGSKAWYHDDKLHRIDGPAWEWDDGDTEWWIQNKWITKETKLVLVCLH
jgi:hypothetical protein